MSLRNIIILICLLITFSIAYSQKNQFIRNNHSALPAERQVYYSVGTIDPRFNLTEGEARKLLHDAARIWEEPLGRQIFFYNPKAAFKVNFIYDQRQQNLNARKYAARELADGDSRNQDAKAIFEEQKVALNGEFRRHNDDLNVLNDRIRQHQQRVALVNSQGGATPSDAQILKGESDQINRDVAVFNQNSAFLDTKQVNLNNQVKAIQSQVNEYNQQARSYNQNFTGHPFEAGVYKGNEINIYEFDNKDNLRLILAHEFGHSLGLKHSNDPKSLMYPTLKEQDQINFKLTQSDIDLFYGRGR